MTWWFWIIMLAFCVAMEAVTTSLVAIWFIPAALVAMILSFFSVPWYWQWLAFVLVGLALVLATRPLCRKFLQKRKPRTNADSAVGQKCLVTEEINNRQETGEVKLNGLKWSARAENDEAVIPVGAEVEVVEISGVKLIVK